jgi:eukaryotic-like serine/threonine-protein kinase
MTLVVPLLDEDPTAVGRYVLRGRLTTTSSAPDARPRYLATAPDGRSVVVTVLGPELASDPELRRRVRAELAAARRVTPLVTAEVLEADVDAPLPYAVTEFIDGSRLVDVVSRDGPLPAAELARLAAAVATALTAVHAAGLAHRDLTPNNVLLTPSRPRVVDVGTAPHRAAPHRQAVSRAVEPSAANAAFKAPEQLLGESSTPAADVYAWGAVVLFAATGRYLHSDGGPVGLVHRVLHEPLDLSGLDDALAPLVSEALSLDPARRPTAQQLLLTLVAGQTASPAPVPARWIHRRRLVLPLLAVAAALPAGAVFAAASWGYLC